MSEKSVQLQHHLLQLRLPLRGRPRPYAPRVRPATTRRPQQPPPQQRSCLRIDHHTPRIPSTQRRSIPTTHTRTVHTRQPHRPPMVLPLKRQSVPLRPQEPLISLLLQRQWRRQRLRHPLRCNRLLRLLGLVARRSLSNSQSTLYPLWRRWGSYPLQQPQSHLQVSHSHQR